MDRSTDDGGVNHLTGAGANNPPETACNLGGDHVVADSNGKKKGSAQDYLDNQFYQRVVASFTERQKSIVENCGFSFLLHLPFIKQHHRLDAWLLSIVDHTNCQMHVDNGPVVYMDKFDVKKSWAYGKASPCQ